MHLRRMHLRRMHLRPMHLRRMQILHIPCIWAPTTTTALNHPARSPLPLHRMKLAWMVRTTAQNLRTLRILRRREQVRLYRTSQSDAYRVTVLLHARFHASWEITALFLAVPLFINARLVALIRFKTYVTMRECIISSQGSTSPEGSVIWSSFALLSLRLKNVVNLLPEAVKNTA